MKAILLAAGLGSRLKPITDNVPKCLVPINGKPLLEYWFNNFKKNNVTEVLINLHHLGNEVEKFCQEYLSRNRTSLKITLVHEPVLLGSAGTILANKDFVKTEERFFILYADNLTNVDLISLAEQNKQTNSPLTVGLFRSEKPQQCGIAELNEENIIVSFVEKPEHPKSNLASAGMFVATPKLFNYFPAEQTKFPFDFGADVMPILVGAMTGQPLNCYIRDIGTHESLAKAEQEATTIF